MEEVVPNLIISLGGKAKHGKTDFSLSFPAPLVLLSFDIGYQPVIKRYGFKPCPDDAFTCPIGGVVKYQDKDGRFLAVRDYVLPIIESVNAKKVQDELSVIWNTFFDDVHKLCQKPKDLRTVIIDTGSHMYRIGISARAKELGVTSLPTPQYGEVYTRIGSLINRCRLAGLNLVITHYLREVMTEVGEGFSKGTGEFVIRGWGDIEAEVDINLRIRFETQVKKGRGVIATNILTILENRYDMRGLYGTEYEDANYEDLIGLLGV